MERGKEEGIHMKICGPTLHAHVPPGGRLLDSTTMVLPGLKNNFRKHHGRKYQGTWCSNDTHLVVGGVVLGLGHVAPELEIDLKPWDG